MNEDLICPYCRAIQETHEPDQISADMCWTECESCGEDYKENFDAMIHWFDTNDFEFADWAKNNMDWSDVSDKVVFVKHAEQKIDFEDGWMNGEYSYLREEE